MTESITLSVFDHNERRKDTLLGVANFEISKLQEDASQEEIVVKVLREGKEVGELVFSA